MQSFFLLKPVKYFFSVDRPPHILFFKESLPRMTQMYHLTQQAIQYKPYLFYMAVQCTVYTYGVPPRIFFYYPDKTVDIQIIAE